MPDKSRKTIGILINQLDGNYQEIMWQSAQSIAERKGFNCLYFCGKQLLSTYPNEKIQNIVYQLAATEMIDGIIIISGCLSGFIDQHSFEDFVSHFRPIPMISINYPVLDIPAVTIDNKSGIRESVRHFVKVHKLTRIAFVKGPEKHPEAEARYLAYLEGLEEMGIPFDPSLVVSGNFISDTGHKAVHELLDVRKIRPQAIISSNDPMLIGVVEALKERKIKVPSEIAVSGFDDINEVKAGNPPATTVRQPFLAQMEKAFNNLFKIMNGLPADDLEPLPSKLIIRQSCGCFENLMLDISAKHIYPGIFDDQPDLLIDLASQKLLPELRELIADSNILPDLFEEWFQRLMEDIRSEIHGSMLHFGFLRTLNEILTYLAKHRMEKGIAQKLLVKIRSHIVPNIKKPEILNRLEDMFQQAQVLFGNYIIREQSMDFLGIETEQKNLQVSGEIISAALTLDDLMKELQTELPRCGIQHFYIALFEGSTGHSQYLKWKLPKKSRLYAAYRWGNLLKNQEDKPEFPTKNLIPEQYLKSEERYSLIIMPLCLRDDYFGYIMLCFGPKNNVTYEVLRGQISSSIKTIQLIRKESETAGKLKKALLALEESYRKLENLSVLDDLTGLYNRRGFMALSRQHLELARRRKRQFLMVFIDLDGLKQINDTYGHFEGDNALVQTSSILSTVFRQTDIIARLGGDEFTILAIDTTFQEFEPIQERLKEQIAQFNETGRKPYPLSMSVGIAPFDPEKVYTIEELMAEADRRLYEEKKKKKAGR